MAKRARHPLGTPTRPVPAVVPALVLALALAAAPAAPAAADTLLVANKSEATVSLVALPGGEVVATLPTGAGPHEIAVSPDGATAVVADYGGREPGATLTVVDVPRARVLRTIDLGEHRRPHGVVFLDETRVAVTVEAAKALLVVDVGTGEVLRAVATGQEVSHMVAVGAGGSRAAVANIGSGSVTLVDLAAGEKLADVPTGAGAEGVAMSADGRWVWVTNREADTVTLVDFAARQVVATIPSADFPIRAELTPDGRHLLVTNAESGDLTVIDTAERAVARRVDLALAGSGADGRLMDFEGSSVPIGVEIAPDGRRAWIAHANADVVQVLDLERWKPVGVIRAGKEPDGMGWSPLDVAPEAERGGEDAAGDADGGGVEAGAAEEAGDAGAGDLVDAAGLVPGLVVDLRYATPDNFVGEAVYPPGARCLLRRPVAAALARVAARLAADDLRLKAWDCYRPFPVQERFWASVADERYVARPARGEDGRPAEGSRHNRGAAVDVTLADAAGSELAMPTAYDDFSERAHRSLAGAAPVAAANARRLDAAMAAEGFVGLPTEWWHYDGPGWERYDLLDLPLAAGSAP